MKVDSSKLSYHLDNLHLDNYILPTEADDE